MSKIDVIIDALSVAQNSVWSTLNEQALAAARELQATYPQGAKVRPAEFVAAATIGANVNFVGTPMIWAEWPTRSEVAMSPEHLPQYIATNNIKPTTEGGGGAGGAQLEQEELIQFKDGKWSYVKKPWVNLTDDEINDFDKKLRDNGDYCSLHFAWGISAKLKEKNNAI
jgi:hypothetical protein